MPTVHLFSLYSYLLTHFLLVSHELVKTNTYSHHLNPGADLDNPAI